VQTVFVMLQINNYKLKHFFYYNLCRLLFTYIYTGWCAWARSGALLSLQQC